AAFTHRMGYLVAMPTLTALMGATAQYLMTGQGPQELRDYFFPRTGELDPQGRAIRLTLPSYMKDVAHYAHDPVGTITGKVHPLPAAVWDMLSNRNFYGGAIRNADDPLIKQLRDTVVHLAESAEPIAVENILKSRSAQVAPWESAANYFGISKAPQWLSMSPAEQLAEDLVHNKLGPGYAPDNPQASDERQALLGQLRQGTQESRQAALGKIRELLRTGQMTRRQASALALESRNVYLVNQVRHLDAREAIRVYRISSPQEKATIHSLVGAKIVRSALPPADKVLLLHELESLNPKE
ncbi:MAG: hypothetical protein KGI89_17325, partial [Euryarchaeota archaeon]|nr:hypothetical protein [Euryarchaeota archaeon]